MLILDVAGWLLAALLAAASCWALVLARRRGRALESAHATIAELRRRPAVLSHEVRNPLALVRGAAELLAEGSPGPLTPMQETFVHTIADNTQLVIDMAEDFLLESRLNAGVTLQLEAVDVRAIAAETAREVRRTLGTDIQVEASGGILPVVSDERLVRQMVWNLVNNAARHAGEGSRITVLVDERADGGAVLRVADTGAGLGPEDRERLFVPFAQGAGRRAGAGLGMTVVQRIAESLQGRVVVDSAPGEGTTVIVDLPSIAAAGDADPRADTAR